MSSTPYVEMRQIEFTIGRIGISNDIDQQSTAAQQSFQVLRRAVKASQATLKDHEIAEADEDDLAQMLLLPKAIKSLEVLRQSLLKASEFELIEAVDVAQLSAQLDELLHRLAKP